MSKKSYRINKKLLLAGDHREILRFGEYYSHANSLPHVSLEEMEEYLSGKPVYLGEQAKEQWGMSFEDTRRCLYDLVRTENLIKGVVAQVQERKQNLNRPICVVEAGGGTGILAIAAALAGADKVILIEINSETVKRTMAIIESLGFASTISVVFANARTFIPEEKIDLLICECLHTGLVFEPQLQIVQHLGKFLQPDAKLIPEGVTLRWSLAEGNWEGITEKHTEYRALHNRIVSHGKWSPDTVIAFKEKIGSSHIENLRMVIPPHSVGANTILIEMDVLITSIGKKQLVLKSGEADFLGHPHAVHLNKTFSLLGARDVLYTYQPGSDFSYEISPQYEKSYHLIKQGISKLIQKVL